MKGWLLAKSNIKKAKGITIALFIMLILASCMLNMCFDVLINYDSNNAKFARSMNAADLICFIDYDDINNISDEYIYSLNKDEVHDCEIERVPVFSSTFKYADGDVNTNIVIRNLENVKSSTINKMDLIDVDNKINDSYIYLPNSFRLSNNYKTGDFFRLNLPGITYDLKIKGFISDVYHGNFQAGSIGVIVDDTTYENITSSLDKYIQIIIKYDLNAGIDAQAFDHKILKSIRSQFPSTVIISYELSNVMQNRTFISLIIGVSLFAVSSIVLIIIFLMLLNSVSNFVKENIKSIGVLKAIGYTNTDIKKSFVLQFMIITILSLFVGISLSYLLLPILTRIMVSQSGIPYSSTFNILTISFTVLITVLIILLGIFITSKNISKITPLVALKDGTQVHNFKKNRVKTDKVNLPINIILSLKTMFLNIKQNIITSIVMLFLVFVGFTSMVMYQNFSRKVKVSILTFETCSAIVSCDTNDNSDIKEYISKLDGVNNTRLISFANLETKDANMTCYVMEDASLLNNKDVCYKGRLPKYDNEIALSGKYAKKSKYKIGDEIRLYNGDLSESFLITGLIQTTNNNGEEVLILKDGADKLLNGNYSKMYYFDTDSNLENIFNDIKDTFGQRIVDTIDFRKIIDGSVEMFKGIATGMVFVMAMISTLVILLVLYILIKTLVISKKKDYGVLKAIGYTSKDIIFQNALSFMPTIIISVIIGTIISYFLVNPYIAVVMQSFGIMKLSLEIPFDLVLINSIFMICISFIFAYLLSFKIKKIEPVKLLSRE